MKLLIDDVLKEIRPTEEEKAEVLASAALVLKKINRRLKNAKAIVGGSAAKGTWLKGLHDIDIFVKFDYNKYKEKSAQLSDILLKSIEKEFNGIARLHGSRDYFQVRSGKFTYEIVPILDVKKAGQAKNITDVSPLHAKWVNKHGKFKDDIRLTKKFCKAAKVYGAESYIKGFSGYVCEVLTISHGGFFGLVKSAAKWKDRAVVDAEEFYKGKDVLMEMNKSKTHSPLTVVDPVQSDRNAAAVLSRENFEKFKLWCIVFLKNPSKRFFVEKSISIEELIREAGKNELIILDARLRKGKEDVIGAKLVKLVEHLRNTLEDKSFRVYGYGWDWDKEKEKKALIYFIVDENALPKMEKRIGPPLKIKKHAELFRRKYKKTFVEGKRVCAYIKREFTRAEDLIRKLLKEKHAREKVKSIKIIDIEH